MKKQIWITSLLALITLVLGMVWQSQRQRPADEPTKNTITDGGTRSTASPTVAAGGSDWQSRPDDTASRGRGVPAATSRSSGGAGTTGSSRLSPMEANRGGDAPPTTGFPEPMQHRGEVAMAAVTLADGSTTGHLRLNQVNAFVPTVHIEPNDSVTVVVTWPEGSPGDSVAVMVEDGGRLNAEGGRRNAEEGARVLKLTLDERRQTRFAYTASEALGNFRVTLRKGVETKSLQFWAGPEPEFAAVE